MPKAKKIDEVAALASRMLEVLEARRSLGPESYPPPLGRLAELCEVEPDDGRVLKAVAKKAFTDRVKLSRPVGLGSEVYFKEDVPDPVVALATKMLRVLWSQRSLGGDAYPPTLGRLAELCGLNGSNPLVAKAVASPTMAPEVTLAKGGKLLSNYPLILNRDLGDPPKAWHAALLGFAFDQSRKPKVAMAFTPKPLSKKLREPLQKAFEAELRERIGRGDLPAGYGWLANKDPLIFRLADILPGLAVAPARPGEPETPTVAAPPAREFAAAFRESFDRLDRLDRLSNNVKLADLRRELADFPREQFDAGLRRLRVDREFSLDSHEGLLRPLTPEEREAGIAEAGSLLVYVSRR